MDLRVNTAKDITQILVPGLLKNTTFNLSYYLRHDNEELFSFQQITCGNAFFQLSLGKIKPWKLTKLYLASIPAPI